MMYDKSIHTNPDARAWAKFFCETKKEMNWTADQINEDLMIGWFANAMMAMHDHLHPNFAPTVVPGGSAFLLGEV